jgi:ABC-type transport system involved in multi-copper enzyme maturation permease subunit
MKSIIVTLGVEILKIRKSKVFLMVFIFFAFIPCMMGLLMFVQKYPEISGKLGMIGTKASMLRFGEANWQNYLNLLNQSFAAIGLIGFGFITTWIFGREYSDNTVKDILSLPISRTKIVVSKFVVIVLWSLVLSVVFLTVGILIGQAIGLSGWSQTIVSSCSFSYFIVTFLTILLCTPVAFFACYSRSFLLPLGFVILTLLIANFTGLVGLGPYFPWAIPGIYSTPAGTEGMHLGILSYIILFTTSILGFIGTWSFWLFADQK